VWNRFGNTANYVEPFAGSLAVLLGRPHEPRIETVNDIDCMIANFWRALQADPYAVSDHADWPVNEADLHARHQWIHEHCDAEWQERMHSDPKYFDVHVAGWWVWGISCWIGDNWCRVKKQRSKPHLLSDKGIQVFRGDGTGLDRRRPHLNTPNGVHRQIPDMSGDSGASGKGIHRSGLWRKRPVIQASERGALKSNLHEFMRMLSDRLRRVRVCCGDWKRVCGPTPTVHCGLTAVFLDPPYGVGDRDKVYNHDSLSVADDVRAWCIEHSDHPHLRIALCGYEGEHDDLEAIGWDVLAWKAQGGYGNTTRNDNGKRERIWFSPNCLAVEMHKQGQLFSLEESGKERP